MKISSYHLPHTTYTKFVIGESLADECKAIFLILGRSHPKPRVLGNKGPASTLGLKPVTTKDPDQDA